MAGRISTSYDDDKESLSRRLRKMEGQVRRWSRTTATAST